MPRKLRAGFYVICSCVCVSVTRVLVLRVSRLAHTHVAISNAIKWFSHCLDVIKKTKLRSQAPVYLRTLA